MDCGFLYFAKGDTFIKEAKISAQRTTEVMPDYPISIVADRDIGAECFDNVIVDESPFEKQDKPKAMKQIPYDRTVFLDSDIYLEDDVSELFELLDNFDIAFRLGRDDSHISESTDVPVSFPEFNSGVIPYRSNSTIMDLLQDWERRCQPDHDYDQISLRPALYHSNARFTCIRNRYNCMYQIDNIITDRVRVFHGPLVQRDKKRIDVMTAREKLNQSTDPRFYYAFENTLFIDSPPNFVQKLRAIYENRGVAGVSRGICRKILRRLQ